MTCAVQGRHAADFIIDRFLAYARVQQEGSHRCWHLHVNALMAQGGTAGCALAGVLLALLAAQGSGQVEAEGPVLGDGVAEVAGLEPYADVVLVVGGHEYQWVQLQEDYQDDYSTSVPESDRAPSMAPGEDHTGGFYPTEPAMSARVPDLGYMDPGEWAPQEDIYVRGTDGLPAHKVVSQGSSSVVITRHNGPVQVRCGGIRCTLTPQASQQRYLLALDGAKVEFANVTFRGWAAPGGGAIVLYDSTATFTEVAFIGNTATDGYLGGAIAVINSTAEFNNCTFENNTALMTATPASNVSEVSASRSLGELLRSIRNGSPGAEVSQLSGGFGGAIAAVGHSVVLLSGCSMLSNEATAGGAIFQSGGRMTLKDTRLSGNTASVEGGALYAPKAESLRLLGCRLSRNRALAGCGGALSLRAGRLALHLCTLQANSASLCGGSVAMWGAASAQMSGTRFNASYATVGGALYLSAGAAAHVSTSSVTAASALLFGGGVAIDGNSSLVLVGTALSGSRSNVGGGHVVMHAGATLRAVDSSFAEGSIHPQAVAPRNGSELGHWAAAEPLLCAGGALLLEGGAKAWCSGCVLSGNSASGRGGAVCSAGSFFAAQDSHFKPSFSSPYAGSGLVVATGASAFTTVANSTITVDAGRPAFIADSSNLRANHTTEAVVVTGNGNATIVDAVYSTADKAMPHQLGVTLESSAGGVYMKGQSSNLRYSGPGGSNKSTLPCSPFTCEAQPAPDGECVNNQLDDLGALLPGDGHSHSLCQAATTLNATFALAAPPEATCPAGLPANCSANQLMRRDTCFAAFDCGPVSPKLEIGPILPESPTMSFLMGIGITLGIVLVIISALVYVAARKKWIRLPRFKGSSNAKAPASTGSDTPSDNDSPRQRSPLKSSPDSDEYISLRASPNKMKEVVVHRPEEEAPPGGAAVPGSAHATLHSETFVALPGFAGHADPGLSATIDMDVDFDADIRPHLQHGSFIGRGGFGEVYKIQWKGAEVAVKVFPPGFCGPSDDQYASYLKELEMMQQIQQAPQIARILGASTRKPHMALLYEFIPGGSLADRIYKSDAPMSYKEILKAGYDIAVGLSHLHPHVIHRDLKPANVMVGGDGMCKLIDFGLSRGKDPYVSYISTEAGGTPNYMAPEMFNGARFNERVDIYSLGMVLYECLTCSMPWADFTNMAQMVFQVSIQMNRPEIPAGTPRPLARLIRRCWADDAQKRPSALDVAQELHLMMSDNIGGDALPPGSGPGSARPGSSTATSSAASADSAERKDRTQAVLMAAAAAGPEAAQAIRSTIEEAGYSGLITSMQGGPLSLPLALHEKRLSASQVVLASRPMQLAAP
eukprot:jgi/Tetstr1/421489/TSEL_012437.t1